MDQVVTACITILSLLLGGAVSLYVQSKGRRERLAMVEADCRVFASTEVPEEAAKKQGIERKRGVGVDLVADLSNRGSHPATVRRWSWFIWDEERGKAIRPVDFQIRLAKLGEQEFQPAKELTEGSLGTPFILGAGEVAVLTFTGFFPGASRFGLDAGTSELRVRYWGSEREYEWTVGEEELSRRVPFS